MKTGETFIIQLYEKLPLFFKKCFMKILHNNLYDSQFALIPKIRSFPFVGQNFGIDNKRILVFAHNIYCKPGQYKIEREKSINKLHYANAITDYLFSNENWTYTFRNFIKASIKLKTNYSTKSSIETLHQIENFINKIAYTNYINDIFESEKANNIKISPALIVESSSINIEILKTLKTTHVVCWGKQVFDYILSCTDIEILNKSANFNSLAKLKNKNGFAFAKIKLFDQEIYLLRIFHPSMPGFSPYNNDTQNILEWFYTL